MNTLHTPADLAATIGGTATARKVLDWRKKYSWPCVEIGRSVRFTDEHVAEILARHTVGGKSAGSAPTFTIEGQTKRSARRSA